MDRKAKKRKRREARKRKIKQRSHIVYTMPWDIMIHLAHVLKWSAEQLLLEYEKERKMEIVRQRKAVTGSHKYVYRDIGYDIPKHIRSRRQAGREFRSYTEAVPYATFK